MSVDGSVACCAGEILVFPVGDVLVGSSVPILLGQAKVNDIDKVALLAQTHQKVVWFHITVDKVFRVNVFNSVDLEQDIKTKK